VDHHSVPVREGYEKIMSFASETQRAGSAESMPSYNLGESAKAAMGELASGQQKAPAFAKPRP
jgi:hypothetical protein